jgi:leucyl/phenylalanyl-tRNA---protein transferase
MSASAPSLTWLEPGDPFPPAECAWGPDTEAPGLLAAGGVLDTDTLLRAYQQGAFPWFSDKQPILWWSPEPRMILKTDAFRLHRSLKKRIGQLHKTQEYQIRFDTAFEQVITECATTMRRGQTGTWIVPQMVDAYCELHRAGYAHSIETWHNKKLIGGLYCVALGHSVFGESMFSLVSDASKLALAALVAFCKTHGIQQIDCQQNTQHLAFMGATEIQRDVFLAQSLAAQQRAAPAWQFSPLYWQALAPSELPNTP